MFSSRSKAQAIEIRMQPTNLKIRGDLFILDYYYKVKSLASNLNVVYKELHDTEIISYFLTRFGPEYDFLFNP